MSFWALLDHTVSVYRPTSTPGSFGERDRPLTLVASGLPVAVRRPATPLANPGPGLTPTGQRVLYADAAVDIRLRDVLVLAGADSGLYEVDEPVTRPRGHHAEIRARAWSGALPVEGS